ncbi:TPA: hypothetical protein ACHDL2_001881, partial [Campylobacter jejuni]
MTSKEPCLNSKKIVLSLATISFLASCANATLAPEIKTYDEANKNLKARSAISMYSPEARIDTTVSNSQTNTIEVNGNGPHSITIEKTGTLTGNDKVIYVHASNSDTLTLTNLTNHGTINGKVSVENYRQQFKGTITVNTFENTGQVNGQIYMGVWGGQGTLTVDQFNNSGTIASSDKGVFFQGLADNKSTINNFNNTGVISSTNKEAVQFTHTNVQTLKNSGTIQSSSQEANNWVNHGMYISDSTIQTFINSGTVKGDGKTDPGGVNGASYASVGVNLQA